MEKATNIKDRLLKLYASDDITNARDDAQLLVGDEQERANQLGASTQDIEKLKNNPAFAPGFENIYGEGAANYFHPDVEFLRQHSDDNAVIERFNEKHGAGTAEAILNSSE
jgi:hypothetical protein